MKKFVFILITVLPLASIAQNGHVYADTLMMSSGIKFHKGQVITIGKGSKPDGTFSFISTKPEKSGRRVFMPVYLTANWTGYKMMISGFEVIGNEITGTRYHLILIIDKNQKHPYIADAEKAIASGEIVN